MSSAAVGTRIYGALVLSEIFFAGIPPIEQFPSGKELLTTAFAPMAVLSPIVMAPNSFAPRANVNIIAQMGSACSLFAGRPADVGADMDAAVFPNLCIAAEHDSARMNNGQSFTKYIDRDRPIIPIAQPHVAKPQEFADASA